MEKILIANRIQTPDGTILWTKHRYDFVCHIDKVNGERYCLDGGNDYTKVSYEKTPPIYCPIYSTDDFEIVRENLLRGTYGKDGKDNFKFVPLCEMSDEWILNVIEYMNNFDRYELVEDDTFNTYLELFHKELDYRYDRQILIED